MTTTVLTGVTTTGTPHLGNYVGAIRPAIEDSVKPDTDSYFFLADYHALIKCHDPKTIHESSLKGAATWLACGLDWQQVTFYRQSDVPQVTELAWILSCICPKGLMNRAHAYKAAVQANVEEKNEDPDHNVEMGLYCYPVLMAADILMFNADVVPVGGDQQQHLEMARDIAQRFNGRFKELFVMPQAQIGNNAIMLTGLDGRKMSKSYGNSIPLFCDSKALRKSVNRIVTNSLEPGQPKSVDNCPLFDIYKAFATDGQAKEMQKALEEGLGWGDAKSKLFELLDAKLAPMRDSYNDLLARPDRVEEILQAGGQKAAAKAKETIAKVKDAIGVRPYCRMG